MANTKLPARLLDTSAIPALNVTGDLTVDTTTLKVDSTNNRVGIGIASPAASLHIAATNNNNNGIMKLGARTWFSHTDQGQTHTFLANDYNDNAAQFGIRMKGVAESDEKFTILGSGNVGIGTTDPNLPLTVTSNSGANAIAIRARSADDYGFMQFYNHAGTAVRGQIFNHNGAMAISTSTTGTARLHIDTSGNVGIGTTSPADRLHVALDSSTTNAEVDVMRVEATSSGTPAVGFGPFIDFRGDRINGGPDSYGRLGFEADAMPSTTVDGAFVVQTAEDGTYSERLRIASGGNVGIGTPSMSSSYGRLTVAGTGISITPDTSAKMQIGRYNASNPYSYIKAGSTSSGFKFTNAADSVDIFTIENGGDVSIGSSHAGFSGWRVLNIRGASANDGGMLNFENSAGTRSATFANQSVGIRYQTHIAGGYHRFETNGNSEAMRIIDNGNVGIGTNSPYGRLELKGNGNSWTTAPAIRMWDDLNNKGWLVGTANNITAGDFYIRTLPSISGTPGATEQEFTIKHGTGNVGIGTTAPAKKLHVVGSGHMVTLENTSTATNEYTQQLFQSGTALNYLWGANQNSAAWGGASSLNVQSTSGAIAFFTNSTTLRMRIHETSGNIDIPNGDMTFASGHGIDFSATANSGTAGTTHTSSLLDDYEEGYWTPILTGSGGGTFTNTQQVGSYTKIGNLIHLTFYLGATALGTATGNIRISNLPYAALSGGTTNSRIVTGSCMVDNLTLNSGRTWVHPYMSHGASDIKFYQSGTGVGWIETPVDASFTVIGGISYRTV